MKTALPAALWFCIALGTLAWGGAAMDQPRPVVVELFTSEGCSSCPPAEAYLAELAQRDDVLALAYHVDYWDDLGWRDRFALKTATQRQNIYAQSMRKTSVYTPQVVIDGREDYVGSDRRSIGRSIEAPRTGVPVTLTLDGQQIRIAVGTQAIAADCDILVVGYLRKAVSPIHRGENSGRTLEEFHIVRSLQVLGHWRGAAQTFDVAMSSLPPDVTNIAVLVQSPRQGPIAGAGSLKLR
jgi:hypothetical protein